VTATAESAQFWSAQEATEATLKKLRRRVTATALVGLVFFVVAVSVFFVKIDGKFSTIDTKVDQIRTTQVSNTSTNDAIERCDVTSGDDFIFDIVRLAQKNPPATGYKIPAPCTALEPARSKG
jgi:hypothetical protein